MPAAQKVDTFWAVLCLTAVRRFAPHASGGAFVHDGRGFRRYALLTPVFLPRTFPAA